MFLFSLVATTNMPSLALIVVHTCDADATALCVLSAGTDRSFRVFHTVRDCLSQELSQKPLVKVNCWYSTIYNKYHSRVCVCSDYVVHDTVVPRCCTVHCVQFIMFGCLLSQISCFVVLFLTVVATAFGRYELSISPSPSPSLRLCISVER